MTREDLAESKGPLRGIRVVDFCTFVAGAYTATLMSDLGADVIKVESLQGDPARLVRPHLNGESRAFLCWSRNKRGLSVDLQSIQGRAIAHQLIRRADVVVENFRPGLTRKLGIDYETLRDINPKLIYCSNTAFGETGPYSHRTGFDAVLQSMSGIAAANVRFAGREVLGASLVIDFHAAMLALSSINAALFHRERTGEGQKIETSLMQAAMSVQCHGFFKAPDAEEVGPGGSAPYDLYQTDKGQLCIAAITPKAWLALWHALGEPRMAEDPRFKDILDRLANQDELREEIESRLTAKSAAEWEKFLSDEGVPCGLVQTSAEFFEDPHVDHMNMRTELTHPTVGKIEMANTPFRFEKTPAVSRTAAPILGEHTEQILRELGYDDAAIDRLLEENIVAKGRAESSA